jgi:hypothetical protein
MEMVAMKPTMILRHTRLLSRTVLVLGQINTSDALIVSRAFPLKSPKFENEYNI